MLHQLSPLSILLVIAAYFLLLLLVSYFTGKNAGNTTFFLADRKSPWYLVAFGMIGASLSGVTFISIPGAVGATPEFMEQMTGTATVRGNIQFSYMQMVFGYLLGYIVIATVLLPIYYRMGLTSIYEYLEDRFGTNAYKTGAAYFLLSRTIGASFRLYLVAIVLHRFVLGPMGISFFLTVVVTILLIWVYTFRGGIKTIVWTDTLQTFCMLLAVVMTLFAIGDKMGMHIGELATMIKNSEYGQMFFFENGWQDPNNFFKQFISGALIAIVMTGLDQDMMQKNLTCRNLKESQTNMLTFSVVLVFVNLLFLGLGALLYIYASNIGLEFPMAGDTPKTDQLYPLLALEHLSPTIGILFILGLIAAAYSSADSALAALTTSFCVDFLNFEKSDKLEAEKKQIRWKVHIGFSVLLLTVVMLFKAINNDSVINELFVAAGYTYGPLLGLFAFGLFTRARYSRQICIDRMSSGACIVVHY